MATGASSTRMVAAGDGVVDIVRRITIGMVKPFADSRAEPAVRG